MNQLLAYHCFNLLIQETGQVPEILYSDQQQGCDPICFQISPFQKDSVIEFFGMNENTFQQTIDFYTPSFNPQPLNEFRILLNDYNPIIVPLSSTHCKITLNYNTDQKTVIYLRSLHISKILIDLLQRYSTHFTLYEQLCPNFENNLPWLIESFYRQSREEFCEDPFHSN